MTDVPNSRGETRLAVIELRRYTLRPNQRDVLIDLFDQRFVEPQEHLGMTVIGQFRDDDHPETFTWLRGFTDMTARAAGLGAFYGGEAWQQHRHTANATMIDSDDVRLLTPVVADGYVPVGRSTNKTRRPRTYRIATYRLKHRPTSEQTAKLHAELESIPRWSLELFLATLDEPNNFPSLPVREHEQVLVAVLAGDADGIIDDHDWATTGANLTHALKGIDTVRLTPTNQSRLQ
jgi:NIPSNAP